MTFVQRSNTSGCLAATRRNGLRTAYPVVDHIEQVKKLHVLKSWFALICWPDTLPKTFMLRRLTTMSDNVNRPAHYNGHPSGIECIQITEHMGFNLGNAVKYIWRCDLKQDAIEDLEKARWYIDREIKKRKRVRVAE
nr:DUF3310 domain-containing protein [Brucella intermedia]